MADPEQAGGVLHSDFDGTAVKLRRLFDPRNWSKYPLEGIEHYGSFLLGAQLEGVRIGSVVSRRPDIWPRRWATARSIADLGLSDTFSEPGQMVLAGSEAAKGAFVVERAQEGMPIGFVDDRPHRIGPSLLAALTATPEQTPLAPITLGVANHGRSGEYMMRFIDEARGAPDETGISVVERIADHAFTLHDRDERFRLDVVQLAPYSLDTGGRFAEQILASAA